MLDDRQVKWLKERPKNRKEEIERMWLSHLIPDESGIEPSPGENDRWDATVSINGIVWWCENKMRFVSERLVLYGGGGKPAGLLTDFDKVEFLYGTGHGLLIHYLTKDDCAYIVRIDKDPSEYNPIEGWFPKDNESGKLVWKKVCFIPVTEANRRETNIVEWMRNAKRN